MANTLFLGGIPLVAGKPPSYISLLVLHSSRQAYLQTSKQKGQFLPVLLLQLFREHHPTTCLSFHFHIPASVLQRVQPSHQASFFFPHSLPVTVPFTPTFAPTRLPSNSPVTTSSPALTVRTLYRDQRVRSSNPFTSIFFHRPSIITLSLSFCSQTPTSSFILVKSFPSVSTHLALSWRVLLSCTLTCLFRH